jgi:hypothetical protein
MKGKILLLIAGIITLVSGAIGLLASLGMVGVSVMTSGNMIVVILIAVTVVVAVAMIVIGIMGIMYRERPDKVKMLMTIGIVLIVIEAIALVINIVAGSSPVSSIGGLILGVLYYIGAHLNKQS